MKWRKVRPSVALEESRTGEHDLLELAVGEELGEDDGPVRLHLVACTTQRTEGEGEGGVGGGEGH